MYDYVHPRSGSTSGVSSHLGGVSGELLGGDPLRSQETHACRAPRTCSGRAPRLPGSYFARWA